MTGTGWAMAIGIVVVCAVVIAAGVLVVRKLDAATSATPPDGTPAPDANAELLRELVRATFLDVHRGPELGAVAHTDPAAVMARLQGGGDWRVDGPDPLGVSNDMSDPMDQAIPPNVRPDAVMVEPGTAEYPWEKKP